MAKTSITLTAQNTATKVCPVRKAREHWMWLGTLTAQGTWGGSTLAWYVSFDSGVTLIPIKDITDTLVSFTSNASINIQLGTSRNNTDEPQIWAELSGGSGANLTVSVFDGN